MTTPKLTPRSLTAAVSERLAETAVAQTLIAASALLAAVVVLSWPSHGSSVNEVWYSLSPTRNALIALIATAFGAAQHLPASRLVSARGGRWRLDALLTLSALLVLLFLTFPLEVVAYAATYPAPALSWGLLINLVTLPAYFGMGLGLRYLTVKLRLQWLLPLLVPGIIVLLTWADFRVGMMLVNPWTPVLAPSPYPLVAGAFALLTLGVLLFPGFKRGSAK